MIPCDRKRDEDVAHPPRASRKVADSTNLPVNVISMMSLDGSAGWGIRKR